MKHFLLFTLAILGLLSACATAKNTAFKDREVYDSEGLILTQIGENSYVHTTYKQTNDFGNVPCNGLVVRNGNEVIVFDTPTTDHGAEELLTWIETQLHCKVKAVIPTHFHDDCLGGLQAFHRHGIPSYAYFKTIELAAAAGTAVPQNSFQDSLTLVFGSSSVSAKFFGEGHTHDNVVGYFPDDKVLFGGCLLKAQKASKGYLGDANVKAWSSTVRAVKAQYGSAQTVVPGHGAHGSTKLLDYTIDLFDEE